MMDACSDIVDGKPCHVCGQVLLPSSKFCLECGTAVDRTPKTTKKIVKCPNLVDGIRCGYEVDQACKFCSDCGFRLPRSLFDEVVRRRCGAICPDGKTCDTELAIGAKFCPGCGSLAELTAQDVCMKQSTEAPSEESDATLKRDSVARGHVLGQKNDVTPKENTDASTDAPGEDDVATPKENKDAGTHALGEDDVATPKENKGAGTHSPSEENVATPKENKDAGTHSPGEENVATPKENKGAGTHSPGEENVATPKENKDAGTHALGEDDVATPKENKGAGIHSPSEENVATPKENKDAGTHALGEDDLATPKENKGAGTHSPSEENVATPKENKDAGTHALGEDDVATPKENKGAGTHSPGEENVATPKENKDAGTHALGEDDVVTPKENKGAGIHSPSEENVATPKENKDAGTHALGEDDVATSKENKGASTHSPSEENVATPKENKDAGTHALGEDDVATPKENTDAGTHAPGENDVATPKENTDANTHAPGEENVATPKENKDANTHALGEDVATPKENTDAGTHGPCEEDVATPKKNTDAGTHASGEDDVAKNTDASTLVLGEKGGATQKDDIDKCIIIEGVRHTSGNRSNLSSRQSVRGNKSDPRVADHSVPDVRGHGTDVDDQTINTTYTSSMTLMVSPTLSCQEGVNSGHSGKPHLKPSDTGTTAVMKKDTQQADLNSGTHRDSHLDSKNRTKLLPDETEQVHAQLLQTKLEDEADHEHQDEQLESEPRSEKQNSPQESADAQAESTKDSESESGKSDEEELDDGDEAARERKKKESKANRQRKKKTKHQERLKRKHNKLYRSNSGTATVSPDTETMKKDDYQPVNKAGRKADAAEGISDSLTTRSSRVQHTTEDSVTVYFHVLFSPSMEFNPAKETASIRFDVERLGGWKSGQDRIVLTQEKIVDCGFLQMCGKIDIPRSLTRKTISYKYVVHQMDGKTRWEHVDTGFGQNREFKIPVEHKNDDVWHQYDGCVHAPEHKKTGLWKQFEKAWSNIWSQHGKEEQNVYDIGVGLSVWYYSVDLQELVEKGFSGIDICKKISQVYDCLRKSCKRPGEQWVDERRFGQHVLPWLQEQWKKVDVKNASSEMKVIMAMVTSWIVIKYKVPFPDDCWRKFTMCMMMHATKDSQKNHCQEWNAFMKNFSGAERELSQVLLTLCKRYSGHFGEMDLTWLCLVPWLHFMRKDCEPWGPYEKRGRHNDPTPTWWGIDQFARESQECKMKLFRNEAMDNFLWDIIPQLVPLFEMDVLLPRTIMALTSPRHLARIVEMNVFPTDVLIATLFYYVSMLIGGYGYTHGYHYSEEERIREECRNAVYTLLDVIPRNSYKDVVKTDSYAAQESLAKNAVYICVDLFRLVSRSHRKEGYLTPPVGLLGVMCLDQLADLHEVLPSEIDPQVQEKNKKMVSEVYQGYESGTVRYLEYLNTSRVSTEENIRVINDLLCVSFRCQWLTSRWQEALLGSLRNGLLKERGTKILDYYCDRRTELNSLHHLLSECLNQGAFRQLERLCKESDSRFDWKKRDVKRFATLLSKVMLKSWPAEDKQTSAVLSHILQWSAFPLFLQFYGSSTHTMLEDACAERIVCAISLLEGLSREVMEGVITVSTFKLVWSNKERLMEMLQILAKNNKLDDKSCSETGCVMKPSCVITALEYRHAELQAYEEKKEKIREFLRLCARIPQVSVDELKTKCQVEVGNCQFDSICLPNVHVHATDSNNYQPVITMFEITPGLEAALNKIELQRSEVFIHLWEYFSKQAQKTEEFLDLEDVLTKIFKPAEAQWLNLQKKFLSGTLSFREVDKHFGLEKSEEHKLRDEFVFFNDGVLDELVKERLKQVERYWNLKLHVESAKAILDLKKALCLTEDFKEMELIISSNMGDNPKSCLNSMDASVERVTKTLSSLNSARQECLVVFSKCRALVDWLKKEIHSQKELKVFVDLASISAGEGDMEIKKVSMLHSATTGYSPLLFDLPKDISCKEFLKRCDEVWKALEADPDLPEKLLDLNRHLKWLEMVKASHGSVEVSSLSQAEAINKKGIYRIGSIPKYKKQQKSLDSTIRLTIPENKTTETQQQEYSYSQLHDLQSRLMLVAGQAEKGKEEVVRFTEVLDSVTRLANTYIKLCQVGSVLFYNLSIVMYNSTQKIVVDFGQDKLRLNTSSKDVNEEAMDLARFLEDCLERWLQYYGNQRSKYFPLNHYTIEQLVILQGELVKVNSHNHVANTTFPLLECVKPHCTERDLLVAMDNALKKVNVLEEETSRPADYLENEKAEFVAAIEKAAYSRKDALRALAAVENPADPEAGLMWCLENAGCDSDSDEESGDGTAGKEQRRFEGWSINKASLETVTEEALTDVKKKERTLCEKLTGVWESFLAAVSGSLSNYMSVEHLGIVLSELAQLAPEEAPCKTLPVGFKTGEPNLIVCPQADILGVTLSIYTSGVKETCPLPTPSEVLLCTVTTTLDQVDIFWRRAIFDPSGKTYCLVNADNLDYDVSDKAERRLEVYMEDPSKNEDYRVVVLCSSEREQRSRIVTALEKYKRPLFTTQESLSKCIEAKLTNEDSHAASRVDISHCTVRVIKSARAGVGKTLYKNRLVEKLEQNFPRTKKHELVRSIPLHGKSVDVSRVVDKLLGDTPAPGQGIPRIIHFNVAYEVQEGVDFLLFNLLILGAIQNSKGFIWRKTDLDLYLVETMPLMVREPDQQTLRCAHSTLDFLPSVMCRSPEKSLEILMENATGYAGSDQLFDEQEFKSAIFQRPFQYLRRLDHADFQSVNPSTTEGNLIECLEVLLRHCGIPDPSWTELRHFVWFLNVQLKDCESSVFCGAAAAGDLPGFLKFVIRFMIKMSRDFATRSLNMSEETPTLCEAVDQVEDEEELLERYQMRRTWESSPHPYIFFNPDHNSMTFLGFNIVGQAGDMVDPMTGETLEEAIMPQQLQQALVRNKVPLTENFDSLPREQKLIKLCRVMGIEDMYDPDDTYELTTDNVKKMLAIYMRFRCGIPVIVMGETGCGKTRLVKFLCSLQKPPELETVPNMVLMKVHGGTTETDIISKVKQAEQRAKENCEKYGSNMFTVLFFDEANTTEAIGLIKEIMCDGCMDGEPLHLTSNLKIVAACNPYRKHSDEMIRRLEQAGLGYHVEAEKTVDRLGSVPMRRLVYRVQALPQSLLPLVWDFGQLNTTVEMMYIRQMVLNCFKKDLFEQENCIRSCQFAELVTKILAESQEFMRQLENECSFVSLRDVERTLKVMCWFYEQGQQTKLFEKIHAKFREDMSEEDSSETEEEEESLPLAEDSDLKDLVRSLVLAIGTCYHACLSNRSRVNYREHIATFFQELAAREFNEETLLKEITGCQDAFLDEMKVGENIARNQALKENVFMMVVAIELRLPLFLVGKPGSSKSLAKTIVADAMQGSAAHGELFKAFKQVQMVSFQCSPLSTADGIVGTFRQCSQFQKDKNLDQFVSVVVLDEIGLAEDSSKMPLKTLHPLLEDGCQGDEKPEPYKKVAFIGISNWALDPAKMNRGVFVQREVPDEEELKESAEGICSTGRHVSSRIKPFVSAMSAAYLHLFERATQERREFFGLRDFYSLLKMLYGFVKRSKRKLTWFQLQHAIKRNFGGLAGIDPVESFRERLAELINVHDGPGPDDPDCSAAGLIKACLLDVTSESESRYLLLLTENYGALTILHQQILSQTSGSRSPITIFGSSFPKDQEYTQICRNINRIKICMETGNTVILLNLENLYESLYDALNQYYVYLGGERFVDLGLGTHRVKCRVHKNFRLVVVAEKEVVYDKFPIPLINRMEKHFLTVGTILNEEQLKLASELQRWAENFASSRNIHTQRSSVKKGVPGDAFVGYHADTAPSVILHQWTKIHAEKENGEEINQEQVLQSAKRTLLWCATPDAVCRLKTSRLLLEAEDATKIYFREQKHESLQEYLTWKIVSEREVSGLIQVTSHSKLLSARDMSNLSQALQIPRDEISLLSLQSFDTEQQFCRQLRKFLTGSDQQRLLIIQCDSGDKNASLVASARYCTLDEIAQHTADIRGEFCILLIVQLPRIAGGCFSGFQIGKWQSVHIDELRAVEENIPDTVKLFGHSIGELLQKPDHPGHVTASQSVASQHRDTVAMNSQHPEPMEVDILEREGSQMDSESETTERLVPPPAHDPVLDTSMFVYKCLQAAAAMVKDDDDNHSRTTARVHLLFDLLVDPAAGELRFADVINKRLVELLNIREHRLTSLNLARSWLCDDAARPDVISRAGTLRRSWMQVIENKITPLLAGIIAFMDTNNNLDLLIPRTVSEQVSDEVSGECETWKRHLWLMLMNDPDATPLDHQELLSPKKEIELREIYSKLFGFGVTITAPKLPFSWILISKIRSLLKSNPEKRDTIARLLTDSGLGRALNSVTEAEHKAELLKYYLEDFISIIHPTSSPCEHQLICQSIHTVLMSRDDGAGIISSLVCVHQVYEECQGHLQNFSGLNRVWKDCAKDVDGYMRAHPDHFLHRSPEILIDVLATQQLLENLQPTKDEMDTPRGKKAWLGKVLSVKPVIERVCQSEGEGMSGEEMKNQLRCEALTEIRNTWSRIEVLKLFIDHVCPPDAKEAKKWKFVRCMALWELIKDKVDFKHLPSLEKVEKFLMLSNKGALHHFFGKLQKCDNCSEEMKAVPMVLPCGHVVCVKCCHVFAMADKECPVCHDSIPKDYEPKEATDDRKSLKAFSSYQQRCNSFFMALVSQLCFANDSPPDDQVVQKLLTFVTKRFESKHHRYQLRTKAMSVLDSGIDPNPVVRSFLLQLLLRASSEADVIEHLRRFFAQAKEVCMGADDSQQDTHDQVEMCLLVTQCFEDSYRNKNCVHQVDDEEQEVLCAAQLLKEARRQGVDGDVNVDTLRNIAKVRYSLTVTAKSLQKVFVTGESTMIPQTGSFRKLVEAARLLCEECGTNWPRIFLMREICRSYGSHSFDEIRRKKLTEWLLPAENTNEQGSADHYVVIGDEYRRLRELLTQVSLGEDIQQLTAFLQAAGIQENVVKTRLLLAVHREITMASVPSESPLSTNSAEIKKKIQDVCLTADAVDRDLINRLFDNQVGESCRRLVVNPQQSMRDQHIMCLVFHLICVVQSPNNSRLLQPIVALARNPNNMTGCYLPTMPEDHLSEVHQALLDARNSGTNRGNENPVMYKCPQGHPYVIGDCGRPAVVDFCREPGCGLRIGGAGHNLTQGNTQVGDADRDTTRPGHVLGAPQSRSRHPAPERSLNPASCSILRALTHMAMYIGANHHSEEVAGLIQPGVTTSLEDFLWDHISVDFDVIQAALGKGFDDVLVLLHHLLDRIHNDVSHGGDEHHNLKNKAGRSKWEEQFNLTYVSPVLSRLEDTVAMLNQKLLNDDRLGGNALMRVLYEADIPEGRTELGNLVEVPAFWRYRSHISLEHLEQVFNQQENQGPGAHSTEQFALLQLFLQQDHVLRAIQYLPSILKLQRLLIQKYQRRIDASEANTMHHMQVYQEMDDLSGREYKKLLHDVSQAWDCVRESIPSHSYPSPKGRVCVPREYCQQSISSNSRLAMLLPSLRGLGLCSYALVHFLLMKQNEFLQQYYQITGKEMSSVDTVDCCYASSLTLAHLISYDPDRDILPLILANSKYSFEVGKGTQVQYDFINFQHQLDSRFFQGKPLLKVEQVETVIFRTEVSSASVFKTLRDKISQVSLWQGVKAQICKELRTVPDVCSALANVDVSISFLVSAPRQPELHLEDFMVNTLKMTEPLYSPKAKAHCQFKHVQALWLLLSLEKMRRLTHHGQDAFEGLEAVFLTELTEEQEDSLKKYLKKLKANKLDLFTEQLHDCLVLRIAVTQDRTAEDFVDVEQTKLRDMLMGHVESSLYENMAAPGMSQPDLYLQDFPEDILCKQSAAVLHQAICQERPSLHH